MQGIDNILAKHFSTVYLMYGFIPSVITNRKIKVKAMIEQYKNDLPMICIPHKKNIFDGKEDKSQWRKAMTHSSLLYL